MGSKSNGESWKYGQKRSAGREDSNVQAAVLEEIWRREVGKKKRRKQYRIHRFDGWPTHASLARATNTTCVLLGQALFLSGCSICKENLTLAESHVFVKAPGGVRGQVDQLTVVPHLENLKRQSIRFSDSRHLVPK
jgi:hypothetical protein